MAEIMLPVDINKRRAGSATAAAGGDQKLRLVTGGWLRGAGWSQPRGITRAPPSLAWEAWLVAW
jgi:hypothetical protein